MIYCINYDHFIAMTHRIKSRKWFQFKERKYLDLLTVLTLLLLSSSLFGSPFFLLPIGSVLFLWAIFLMLQALDLSRSQLFVFRIIAVVAMVLDVIVLPNHPFLDRILDVIAYFCYSLFLILAIVEMSKQMFAEEVVTHDSIFGGICIYLMLGLLWGLFYNMIFLVDSEAFNNLETGSVLPAQKLLYFSFTTLTTLGYGDIFPVHRVAMTLANFQAIVGQMFPSIFIARLVGLYSHEENMKRQELKEQSQQDSDDDPRL